MTVLKVMRDMPFYNLRCIVKYIIPAVLLVSFCEIVIAEDVTFNLKDAELSSVIAVVSEITGKNFIVDPRVKGRVTVVSSRPMSADVLYEVFMAILNVHGYAAIAGDNAIKIVPEINAKEHAIPMAVEGERLNGEQIVTRVLHVNNVVAAQLVPILRPLLPQGAHLAVYVPGNVLIVSASDANARRIAELISSVDQRGETDSEVIMLQHASALEIERIMNSLSDNAARQAGISSEMVKIISDNRTNSILLSGSVSGRNNVKKIISKLDTHMKGTGNTQVFYLNYAKADDLAKVLNSISQSIIEDKVSGTKKDSSATVGQLNIQADVSTNALVISAPQDVMQDIASVIRKLDVRRAQVVVRAVVAEVSTEFTSEIGVQWGFDSSHNDGPIGLIDFNNTLGSIASAVAGLTAPPVLPGMTLAGGRMKSGNTRFGALLRALQGDANNNILATPTLVTLDGEEAEIVVGQNVPFITGSYANAGATGTPQNPFQTIQRQDVGLSLRIKPQINEGDAIRMEITQEVSSLSAAADGASDLITNKRSLRTTVMVDDGKILVLGGLINETQIETNQRVPLLGDIPVLGHLFRYQSSKNVKQDLMIFLHPRILRDENSSSSLSSGKYNYIRARQLKSQEDSNGLFTTGKPLLLPVIDEFLELPPPFKQQLSQ